MKKRLFPLRPHLTTLMGPAFIWAATAQGSGELIWWPYLVARYGKAFLFLLLPAALIQYFVNREIAKFTLVTGKGIWSGFLGLNKWYAGGLFGLCFLNFLWLGGYASAGGSSLYEILKFPFENNPKLGALFWSYVLITVFSAGLTLSRVIYNFIERVMKWVTAITMGGLILAVILIVNWNQGGEFLGALINPFNLGQGVNWQGFDYAQLISGVVFAGMGGYLNLMYSYWMKEKGVGMAIYEKKVEGLRVKTKQLKTQEMLLIEDSETNQQRYRSWLEYLSWDSGLAVGINALTIVLTSLLSFVLLWPERNYPQGWSITVAQSKFFEYSFGVIGRVMFLIVAAAFLVDTWLALVDGVARQYADFTKSLKFKFSKEKSEKFWYFFWLVFLIGVSVVTMPLAQPGLLLKMVGIISVFAFVAYIPGIWYLNYRKLPTEYPKWIKTSRREEACLWITWGIYSCLALWYLGQII